MSPTRFFASLLTALFVPAALLVVLRARFTTYDFDVDLHTYDIEPQLHIHNPYPPMPRELHPKGAYTLN